MKKSKNKNNNYNPAKIMIHPPDNKSTLSLLRQCIIEKDYDRMYLLIKLGVNPRPILEQSLYIFPPTFTPTILKIFMKSFFIPPTLTYRGQSLAVYLYKKS